MKYIDISEHQGKIDFTKVKGNVDGVMIRVGYGKGNIDKCFAYNISECNRLGIPCGGYWFSYAYTEQMAFNEANYMIQAVKPYFVQLPLAFDYEYDSVEHGVQKGAKITPQLVQSMTISFCNRVLDSGYWCLLYANPDYITRYFGNLAEVYDLWFANWLHRVDVNKPPRACGLWQWGLSSVPGVSGRVDSNEAYRSYNASMNISQYKALVASGTKHLASRTKIIFIGDSRTVGMHQVVGSDGNIWSCKTSMGLSWMKSTGVPSIENQIAKECAVCILMGINDMLMVQPSDYSSYINQCSQRWVQKGASVYFVSVNPVGSPSNGKYGNLTNEKIQEWNQKLRNGLSIDVGYIDTFSAIASTFVTVDGLHYDRNTYLNIYSLITSSALQGTTSLYSNPSVIGGRSVQIDYTKLNPYIITVDRNTSSSMKYQELKSTGVVGAILETGYLFDEYHNKVQTFLQPMFTTQLQKIIEANLEFGYYITSRARTVEEARSELYELTLLLRRKPPRLGVWVKLEQSNNVSTNDSIIDLYKQQLVRLGFRSKIGLYCTKESLNNITWDTHQNDWLLWIIDHVQDNSELQVLLDPTFFDMDGV